MQGEMLNSVVFFLYGDLLESSSTWFLRSQLQQTLPCYTTSL